MRTNKTSGHGIGSSLEERIAEQADELAFLYDQLGMRQPSATPKTGSPKAAAP